MKKLLFALCALAAIALLTPSAGFAQDWQNRIGVYTTATAAGTDINPMPAAFSQFTVYFVLTSPTENGVPMTSIKGWEYKVTVAGPAGGLVKVGETFAGQNVNIGDTSNIFTGATYLLGLAAPTPVVNGMVMLHSWTLLVTNVSSPYLFYLSPATPATFAGRLAFLNATNGKIPADGSQTDFADEVFAVGSVTDPVAVETESFGAVKALFR
jgi:hypothetical protein